MDPHSLNGNTRSRISSPPAGIRGRCLSSAGFTLLELLAVIFIVAMVAALVFPSFGGFGREGVREDARTIAALLRYLNDSAIYMKPEKGYPLQVDLKDGSLSWAGPEGEKSDRLHTLVSLDLQSQGELRVGQVTVFFGPTGLQEYMKFRLRDEDKSMTVAFNPVSGRVKIIEDEK